MSNNFYIGLFFLVAGVFYGIYSLKRTGKKFDGEGGFGKSVIVGGVLGSFVLIMAGLYLMLG